MNLFNTPGAGPSNLAAVNRNEAPGAAPDQPRVMDPPRQTDNLPQYVTTPPGHFSSPLDNMIAAASRLAAIPMEGDSLAAVETRRARDLLQTAVVQQQAYSYSRDRIHQPLVRAKVIAGTWMNRQCQVVRGTIMPLEGLIRCAVV